MGTEALIMTLWRVNPRWQQCYHSAFSVVLGLTLIVPRSGRRPVRREPADACPIGHVGRRLALVAEQGERDQEDSRRSNSRRQSFRQRIAADCAADPNATASGWTFAGLLAGNHGSLLSTHTDPTRKRGQNGLPRAIHTAPRRARALAGPNASGRFCGLVHLARGRTS
jgi:hypothetical protein